MSDWIILLKMVISKAVFTFLSVYASQVGRTEPANEWFYNQLQYAVTMAPATKILIPVGDWNGHVAAPAGVFSDVLGDHSFGTHNTENMRIWIWNSP